MLINTQKDSAQTVLVLHYTGGGMKEYRSRYKGEQKRALCTIMRSALTWTFHNSWGQWDKKEGDKDFPSTQKARCFFSSYSLLSALSVSIPLSLPLLTHLSWRKLVLAASSARSRRDLWIGCGFTLQGAWVNERHSTCLHCFGSVFTRRWGPTMGTGPTIELNMTRR